MSIIRLQRFAATMPSGWALSAFSALMLLTPPSFAQAPAGTIPGLMYEWRIMSLTGQTPINANAPLNGMFEPSINENGAVAFIGEFTGGGEGVVAAIPTATSPTLAQTLVSALTVAAPPHLVGTKIIRPAPPVVACTGSRFYKH